MEYVRCYADDSGETHFERLSFDLLPGPFAPPAPPLNFSAVNTASGFQIVEFPVGWFGEWHPTPIRQIFFILSGTIIGEASDGDRQEFGPGTAALLEDTWGKGHQSWVLGDQAVCSVVVQLPAQEQEQ